MSQLTITVTQVTPVVVAQLAGIIDETANFEAVLGAAPAALQLHCGNVKRINSTGVKAWMKYFLKLEQAKTKIEFVECSAVIVEQFNSYKNFAGGGVVKSIHLPFVCESCKTHMTALAQCDALKAKNFEVPNIPCRACGKTAVFDDLPDEYFMFLMR